METLGRSVWIIGKTEREKKKKVIELQLREHGRSGWWSPLCNETMLAFVETIQGYNWGNWDYIYTITEDSLSTSLKVIKKPDTSQNCHWNHCCCSIILAAFFHLKCPHFKYDFLGASRNMSHFFTDSFSKIVACVQQMPVFLLNKPKI